MYYTLGQRKGLGIGGEGTGEPWFVYKKDLNTNTLYVVQGEMNPLLFSNGLIGSKVNWTAKIPEGKDIRLKAKFRYRQQDQDVVLNVLEGGRIKVMFDKPQKAVTPGQQVVLYDGDECLGGAEIDEILSGKP